LFRTKELSLVSKPLLIGKLPEMGKLCTKKHFKVVTLPGQPFTAVALKFRSFNNMDFKEISNKAIEIRQKYHFLEEKRGHIWSNSEIMEGLVGDIGDLMKLIMAKEGSRSIDNVDEKLKHELCDCLWCLLVLANKYGINLETEFMEKMDSQSNDIDSKLKELL
jgi:NTP pyrophosphatase (non-canonical NTP hydrolase)